MVGKCTPPPLFLTPNTSRQVAPPPSLSSPAVTYSSPQREFRVVEYPLSQSLITPYTRYKRYTRTEAAPIIRTSSTYNSGTSSTYNSGAMWYRGYRRYRGDRRLSLGNTFNLYKATFPALVKLRPYTSQTLPSSLSSSSSTPLPSPSPSTPHSKLGSLVKTDTRQQLHTLDIIKPKQQHRAISTATAATTTATTTTTKPSMYTASFAFFEAIWEAGVTHCFVNLGSDHPSIIEAMVKGQRESKGNFPRIITCPNEVRTHKIWLCIPSH